ncbi:MAG: Gfo/Idh/MocA family oxidoreductase [Paludisphaera borealis]|uniref:Gfo/Idh/MocA family protein n=1 Tax=Paludisphaera borealis TaxID=1387353 RepID=UPI00285004B5|nr:Gfo/Idh/MocA family oxidoreductase [Paludisphaera borealis]MDR3620883.1 Gfo/Idh/MocA family oxidoreductase [Paludisphaera borealis]
MPETVLDAVAHLPEWPVRRDWGIGVVGAGFIVRDCHLVAYNDAGFQTLAITSRTESRAREVAEFRGVPRVYSTVEALLDDPEIEIVDVAVPPAEQPAVIRRIVDHPRKVRGILAQKPLAFTSAEARDLVAACDAVGIALQVNQNMRYDHSVRALRALLDHRVLGDPVLATIELRAIPHWMPWARDGRSLSTFIMSIHHLDTFRYWLGDPQRVLASTRPDPRTTFAHADGINLAILEFANGARASSWDDVWAGPAREGAGADLGVRWRFEGTDGLALGTIGWPAWPRREPSTLTYSTRSDHGKWHKPVWPHAWFPDAFAGPMSGLMRAIEDGSEPDISGRDNLRTIALCEAVLAAASEHRVVPFAEFLS